MLRASSLLTSVFFLSVFLTGCKTENDKVLFTQLSETNTGINFKNTLFEDGPLNVANYI